MTRIAYLVHDLGDPAVHRRVQMLQAGGARVTMAGFRRAASPGVTVDGQAAIDLGRTQDARLARRCVSVARAALLPWRWRRVFAGADVVVARQLEMLVLAAWGRRLFAPHAGLVYECLDIHRAVLGSGPAHRALRWIEAALLRRCGLLIVSAPMFITMHFSRYHRLPPFELVENRVLAWEVPRRRDAVVAAGPPWRIGWLGNLRCAESLRLLADLVRSHAGLVEVVMRGRVAQAAIPEFDATVSSTPGLSYAGPYDRQTDLPGIYSDVHFTWAIDRSEAGGNSEWLLPNRLYEGGVHGCVTLAQQGTATAAWLATHDAGVILPAPIGESLTAYFTALTPAAFTSARRAIDPAALVYDEADCRRLVGVLTQACHGLATPQAARRSLHSTPIAS